MSGSRACSPSRGRRPFRALRADAGGATSVEFGLISGVLFALLFGQHWILAESTLRSAETTGGTVVLVEIEVVYLIVGGTVRLLGEWNVQV